MLIGKRTEQGYIELECGCTYADANTVVYACERDRYMTPEEAKAWGHIDDIVTQRDLAEKKAS